MKRLLLAAVLIASPAIAADSGPYISGQVGLSAPRDSDISSGALTGKVDLDNSAMFSGAIGYRFNPNFRAEAELAHRSHDIKDVSINGLGSLGGDGHINATTLMLNGYYDFPTSSMITPYLTAGLGAARLKAKGGDPAVTLAVNDSDTVFAYQVGAGLSFAVAQNTALTVGYHYLGTSDPSFNSNIGKVDTEYHAHEFNAGVRVSF